MGRSGKASWKRWHLTRDMKRARCGCAEIWGERVSGGRNCSAKALRRECAGSAGGTRRPRCGLGLGVREEDGGGVLKSRR